ncbi:MAG: V-type ATPase subunit [Candidatus Natronoplasma sp.]
MIEEFLESVGLTNFVFIIVGLALLIVVILFMSYYRTIISIANFTYPNAVFRSTGNPYLKREKISDMIDRGNLNEIYSELEKDGYEIPKDIRDDIEKIESEFEEKTVQFVKKAYDSSPDEIKQFTRAWMAKYDVKMAKRALKAMGEGQNEDLESKLYPVKEIDQEVIDDLISARNIQETLSILKETDLGEALEKKEWKGRYFELDVALDKYQFKKIKKGMSKVEADQKAPVQYFFGRYTDLWNIKIIIRGHREEIEEEKLKDALLPQGRELADWKLEEMAEAKNLDEALIQLEGTSYEDIRKKMQSDQKFDFEKYLDEKLLKMTVELTNQYVLTVGPTLKYLVGKEFELRNIRALIRGIKENVDPKRIEELMILEDNI